MWGHFWNGGHDSHTMTPHPDAWDRTNQHPESFVRPQKTVEDLEAEYTAWAAGDHDEFDKVVKQVKTKFWTHSAVEDVGRKYPYLVEYINPEPKTATAHGKCECGASNMDRVEEALLRRKRLLEAQIRRQKDELTHFEGRLKDIEMCRADYPDASPDALPRYGYHKMTEGS